MPQKALEVRINIEFASVNHCDLTTWIFEKNNCKDPKLQSNLYSPLNSKLLDDINLPRG